MLRSQLMCAGMLSSDHHEPSASTPTMARDPCAGRGYTIASLQPTLLTSVLGSPYPFSSQAAGIALTPFKPFLVSSLNSAAMEVKYLHRWVS